MTYKVDPITVATTWHYIQRVCREMRENAERTATNVLVVTLHDMAYGIWDAEGRVIAIPEGFPPRLISSTVPIRRVKAKFGKDIHPGDVFLTNYPQDGAVHLPDWVFVRPIFYKKELVFFTCMGTHVADSGGALPGTQTPCNLFCPVSKALLFINKKWSIEIIRDMFFGKKRFKEFKEGNPNLSNKVLSDCLKNLENNGLIEKRIVNSTPISTKYHLTERGKALNRVIYELAVFALEDCEDEEYAEEATRIRIKQNFKETLQIDD